MKALVDIAKANHCDRIATAHQKNDNAETVLQRLSRGTGFRGLGGIWPKRVFADGVTFIRPMLSVTRREVIEYLHSRNLTWRRDRTNTDCTYRRNFIRHRLLPELQQDCNDSLVDTLSELTLPARRFYEQVCRHVDEVWPGLAECTTERTMLDLIQFQSQPTPARIELIRRSLARLGSGQRDITRRHYERIVHLAEQKNTDKRVELPNGFVVQREYGNILFSRSEKVRYRVAFTSPIELKIPGKTKYEKYLIEATIITIEENAVEKFMTTKKGDVECFDLEKVKLPLYIRSRRPGDRFVPLGLGREKKIGKFLTAQHVPHDVRRNVIVVEDRKKIIWVWPIRISEQAKVTGDTLQILQLQVKESADD
jgi:tRNA(Ile)-lysidine synthase